MNPLLIKTLTSKYTIGTIVVIGILLMIYFYGRSSVKKGKYIDVPDNLGGYNPNLDATALHEALKGWGTDTETVTMVLSNKTDQQLALIYNAYLSLFNQNLLEDIEDDYQGAELQQVLSYFKNLDLR